MFTLTSLLYTSFSSSSSPLFSLLALYASRVIQYLTTQTKKCAESDFLGGVHSGVHFNVCCIYFTDDSFLSSYSYGSKLYLPLNFYFLALPCGKRKTKNNPDSKDTLSVKMVSPRPAWELSPPRSQKGLEEGSSVSHYDCHTFRKTPVLSSSLPWVTGGKISEHMFRSFLQECSVDLIKNNRKDTSKTIFEEQKNGSDLNLFISQLFGCGNAVAISYTSSKIAPSLVQPSISHPAVAGIHVVCISHTFDTFGFPV